MLPRNLTLDRLSVNAGAFTLIGLLLVIVVFVVPALAFDLPDTRQDFGTTEKATVKRVLVEETRTGPRGTEHYQRLELDLNGSTIQVEHSESELDARRFDFRAGDKILVNSPSDAPAGTYFIADYARDSQLWIFFIAFAALVIFVGRWQGLSSLVGMATSLLVILRFIIPGIVSGHDPVLIAVAGSFVIMVSSLYLAHGVNRKTTAALVGTAISLCLTAGLATLAVSMGKLSGLADEQAATLNIISSGGINPEGLLLAGMIIGALGVLDDVTVAQASAVLELRHANPSLRPRELFTRAMNIGRDHIASTVNTLFLAYAGAALPLLILLSLQTEPASILLNREFLAVEVLRTLVGSIGIVASVPVTTLLAAFSVKAWASSSDAESGTHMHRHF